MIIESKLTPRFGVSHYLKTRVIVTPHRVDDRSRTQIIYLYNILTYKRYTTHHIIPIHYYVIT